MKFCIVTAWHSEKQRDQFLQEWNVQGEPDWLVLQQDKLKEGCARTKNRGIEEARERDPEYIISLDDDCLALYPGTTLEMFAEEHIKALQPQEVEMFEAVTDPPSRGTPFYARTVTMPVAASMGWWTQNPDYDAVRQLTSDEFTAPMRFFRKTMFWKFFAMSGMNLAWNDKKWRDCSEFVDIPRFDDIFCGICWQKVAYEQGYCFNLRGPDIRHVRQSNVWANLKIESRWMEFNEVAWQLIFRQPKGTSARDLRRILGEKLVSQ